MARWQSGLETKQAFLGRVVDIGTELFAMSACVSRVELLRETEPERTHGATQLADAFCRQSRGRAEALFDDLWDNTDATDAQLAKEVLAGDYEWAEEGVIDQSEGTGPWIAEWSDATERLPDLRRPYGSG